MTARARDQVRLCCLRRIRIPSPANAKPINSIGLDGSSVPVEGKLNAPATAAVARAGVAAAPGVAVGATAGVAPPIGVAVGAVVPTGDAVGATVGVAEGAMVNGGRVGGIGAGGATAHVGLVMVLLSRVSAPVSEEGESVEAPTPASSRPTTFALVPTEIDVCARMVP